MTPEAIFPAPSSPATSVTSSSGFGEDLARLAREASRLFDGCEPVERLAVAARFGHVVGQPGWPELGEALAASANGLGTAGAVRAIALAGAMYAEELQGRRSLDALLAFAEGEIQREKEGRAVETPRPLLDPKVSDALEAISGAAQRSREEGLAPWLSNELELIGTRLREVRENTAENEIEVLLAVIYAPLPLPLPSERAALEVVHTARALACDDLARLDVEIIAPLPGERYDPALHQVVGGEGDTVRELVSAGSSFNRDRRRLARVNVVDKTS